jgi:hypothetical protein
LSPQVTHAKSGRRIAAPFFQCIDYQNMRIAEREVKAARADPSRGER